LQRIFWLVASASLVLAACSQRPESPAPEAAPPEVAAPAATPSPAVLEPPAETPDATSDTSPSAPHPATDEANVSTTAVRFIQSEMASKDEFSKKLWAAAGKIDDLVHIGTMFNEIHAREHSCHILGHLMDREEAVSSLAVVYEPDYITATMENAHELRVLSQSLSNYVYSAKRILELSRDEQVLEWNIDCVGFLDIPRSAFVRQDGQSSFYVVKANGTILQVLGDIESDFASKVIHAIESNPGVTTVALGSGGGHVYEALQAGDYIRSKGLSTILWNGCYSACPLVFVGGVQRSIMSPYPDLGFHQIYTAGGEAIPLDSAPYRHIFLYLTRMDIDATYVVNQMWSAAPSEMTMVDGYDDALCDANIATWVQRGCTSRSYRSSQ
jgi:hypothetical protein